MNKHRLTLPFLETMVSYTCNLSCTGCTNYSDYNVPGTVSWEEGKASILPWIDIIDIKEFSLIGGEPLLNKDLVRWLTGCREILPHSKIILTTNGTLLMKNIKLLDTLFNIGNCYLKISIHEHDKFYAQEILKFLFQYKEWQEFEEYGVKKWKADNDVSFAMKWPKVFVKTFKGEYNNMLPHANNPVDAFKLCCQQTCPLLYNGKIYKCSSIGLLEKTLKDWNQQDDPLWQPYLAYQGISINSSPDEIKKFIDKFGKPESICSMCPTEHDFASMIPHATNVKTKAQWIKQNM